MGLFFWGECYMLKYIEIENFKAFNERTRIDLSRMTVFSGENSSGKSSIYQSLLLFSQSLGITSGNINSSRTSDAILVINGPAVRMGSPEELRADNKNNSIYFKIVPNSKGLEEFEFRFSDIEKKSNSRRGTKKAYHLTDFKFNFENNDLNARKYIHLSYSDEDNSYTVKGRRILDFRSISTRREIEDILIDSINKESCIEKRDELLKLVDDGDYLKAEVQLSKIEDVSFREGLFIDQVMINPSNLIEVISDDLQSYFDIDAFLKKYPDYKNGLTLKTNIFEEFFLIFFSNRFHYLPAFRGSPRRIYTEGEEENPLESLKQITGDSVPYDFEDGKVKKGTVEEALNYWIRDYFDLAEEVVVNHLVEGFSTEILLRKGTKLIPINHMGFGVSQIIPIIYKALVSYEGSFIVVDEPEIHLHPKLQSKLADFFIAMVRFRKYFIIETHSEPFLQKLVNIQIESPNTSNLLRMFWVERNGIDSNVREVKFDELGFFENPPTGFLDERQILIDKLSILRKKKLGIE